MRGAGGQILHFTEQIGDSPRPHRHCWFARSPVLARATNARYERYAAVLAATEPLRARRDARAQACVSPLKRWWLARRGVLGSSGASSGGSTGPSSSSSSGSGLCNLAVVDPKGTNHRLRTVCSDHAKAMGHVIKALGMTVPEFNTLSTELNEDDNLKAKVSCTVRVHRERKGPAVDAHYCRLPTTPTPHQPHTILSSPPRNRRRRHHHHHRRRHQVMEQAYFFRVVAALGPSTAAGRGLQINAHSLPASLTSSPPSQEAAVAFGAAREAMAASARERSGSTSGAGDKDLVRRLSVDEFSRAARWGLGIWPDATAAI